MKTRTRRRKAARKTRRKLTAYRKRVRAFWAEFDLMVRLPNT